MPKLKDCADEMTNDNDRNRLRAAAASAIEARSDATPKSDAAEGESAGPKDDAQ